MSGLFNEHNVSVETFVSRQQLTISNITRNWEYAIVFFLFLSVDVLHEKKHWMQRDFYFWCADFNFSTFVKIAASLYKLQR